MEAEAVDKSLSVVEEQSVSSEVTFAENRKKKTFQLKVLLDKFYQHPGKINRLLRWSVVSKEVAPIL